MDRDLNPVHASAGAAGLVATDTPQRRNNVIYVDETHGSAILNLSVYAEAILRAASSR